MKFIKFAALILAITFMTMLLPACGEVVTVNNVRLGFTIKNTKGEEEAFIGTMVSDIKAIDGEEPSILDAVIQILEENGITYKLDSTGESIRTIKARSETTRNGYAYYWEFTVNGKPGKRAGETLVQENDIIVYTLNPVKVSGGSADTDENGEDVVEDVVDEVVDEEAAE